MSEIIRWQTPLAHMRRTALQDYDIGGKTIRKGDKVLMWATPRATATRRSTRWRSLDHRRPMVRRHLSFGFGIHRCVDSRCYELQLQVLWEEILKRFDKIEVLEEPEHIRAPSWKGVFEDDGAGDPRLRRA